MECSENKFLISERVNSIHFEPGLHWRRWIRWIKSVWFHLIHLLQCNPGSKIGIQYIKWGTYFSRIPNISPDKLLLAFNWNISIVSKKNFSNLFIMLILVSKINCYNGSKSNLYYDFFQTIYWTIFKPVVW